MEYIASSAEDRRLHDKYHKQNTEGYDVGKAFVQRARPYSTFEGLRPGDTICALDCLDDFARKRRGQDALEVVQRELGAVEIPERAVWDAGRYNLPTQPDYKAYLYVRGTKCIGVLLVQKIKEAYRVVEPVASSVHSETRPQEDHNGRGSARHALEARQQAEAERLQELAKQPLQLSEDSTPAVLGISRIWSSPTHRHQNIAMTLLDTAFKAHNERADQHAASKAELEADPKLPIQNALALWARIDTQAPAIKRLESKEDVAFSQPTEAGTRLARRWFGKMFGWGVYVD
jgi:N-acetyltransferase